MAIIESEITQYKAATNDDTSSNGGRIDETLAIVDNTANNIFPDLFAADLTAGKDEKRKLFFRVEDSENGDLTDAGLYLDGPSSGDTELYLLIGSQTDTQGSPASTDLYGTGLLDSGVSSGGSSVDVAVKDGTKTQFRDGDEIVINDGTNSETHVINGTPSVASDVVTITLTGTLANNFSATVTKVSCVADYTTVSTSVSGVVETTTSGTFDEAQVVIPNIGAIYHTITLTFTSATAFNASSDVEGSLGSGNTSSTFAPTNANTGTAYFSIPSSVWGGTWASAETVVFVSNPATLPVWVRRVTPAGASANSGQQAVIKGKGQTA